MRDRLVRHARAQGFAFDKFSRDEVTDFRGANVIDGDDVRMIERDYRARFLAKALHPLRVSDETFRQNLQRHFAILPGVLGQIDITHSAPAQDSRMMR